MTRIHGISETLKRPGATHPSGAEGVADDD